MKKSRVIIAVGLLILGLVSFCFWVTAIREAGRMIGPDKPATREQFRECFPAFSTATRIYGVDLFEPVGSREAMQVIWRLNGQLWRPVYVSLIAVGVGFLLLPIKARWRWLWIAGRIIISLFTMLLLIVFVNSWLRRNTPPVMTPYPLEEQTEQIDGEGLGTAGAEPSPSS